MEELTRDLVIKELTTYDIINKITDKDIDNIYAEILDKRYNYYSLSDMQLIHLILFRLITNREDIKIKFKYHKELYFKLTKRHRREFRPDGFLEVLYYADILEEVLELEF